MLSSEAPCADMCLTALCRRRYGNARVELATFDQVPHFIEIGDRNERQGFKRRDLYHAMRHLAQRQLPENERVWDNLASFNQAKLGKRWPLLTPTPVDSLLAR